MSDLRTAAQQALEALYEETAWFGPTPKGAAAIAALKAALAQQDEPVEPVAWECKAGGLKRLTQRQYDAQPDRIKRHYTRTAPPRRTMVPLTEEEIIHIGMTHQSLRQVVRAVERAHGIT